MRNGKRSFVLPKTHRRGGFVRCVCYMGVGPLLKHRADDPTLVEGDLLAHFCRCDLESGKRRVKGTMSGPARKLEGINNLFLQIKRAGT